MEINIKQRRILNGHEPIVTFKKSNKTPSQSAKRLNTLSIKINNILNIVAYF